MSTPHIPWKDLEGQRLRIDVGSTSAEALASTENSTIYFTTDGYVIMNGYIFAGPPKLSLSANQITALLSPGANNHVTIPIADNVTDGLTPAGFISNVKRFSDWGIRKVNVCKAIPTRPRKGQIYYFPGRPHMVLVKERFKEEDIFPGSLIWSYRLAQNGEGWRGTQGLGLGDISIATWEQNFGNAVNVEVIINLGLQKQTPTLIEILEEGFFAEEKIEVTIANCTQMGKYVSSSPNFEFVPNGVPGEGKYPLKVRCIKEPPLVWGEIKALAYFKAKAPRRHIIVGQVNRKIKAYEKTTERGQWVRIKNPNGNWLTKFFAVSRIKRGKVSVKKAFVRAINEEGTRYKTYEMR